MQNYVGKLTCTGKYYCDIYMLIYYSDNLKHFWLCINYNTKEFINVNKTTRNNARIFIAITIILFTFCLCKRR